MKIFVTGHKGHIGRDLMPVFEEFGEVTGYDMAENPLDITQDADRLRERMPDGVDYVFHMANIPHPSAIPIEEYQRNNVLGMETLLRVCQYRLSGKFVFFSSLAALGFDALGVPLDEFTGDEDWPIGKPPWDETNETLPLGDWEIERYGTSKVNQEFALALAGLDYLSLRLGPYGVPSDTIPDRKRQPIYKADAMSKPFTVPVVRKILEGNWIVDDFKSVQSDTWCPEHRIMHVCRPGMWGGQRLQEFLV